MRCSSSTACRPERSHRREAGPHQPGQAPGAGHPRAGVRPADVGDGDPARRGAAARRAHPPTGGAGDRVPDREADRGTDHGRRGAGRDGGGVPRHRDHGLALLRAASACPTPSPTTPAPRGSSSAPGVAPRTSWSTSASSAASSGHRGSDRHRGGWRRDGPSGRGAGLAGGGAGGPGRVHRGRGDRAVRRPDGLGASGPPECCRPRSSTASARSGCIAREGGDAGWPR